MKSAEELAAGLGWFVHDTRVELIREIIRDAWRRGMTDAASVIAGGTNNDSNTILAARDAKKTQ